MVWIRERVRIKIMIRVRVRVSVKFKIEKNTKLQKSKRSIVWPLPHTKYVSDSSIGQIKLMHLIG
jgi:hypothetical protein